MRKAVSCEIYSPGILQNELSRYATRKSGSIAWMNLELQCPKYTKKIDVMYLKQRICSKKNSQSGKLEDKY